MEVIKITPDQKKKLIKKIGEDNTNYYIEALENYLMAIGKPNKYKSQYHAVISWYNRDKKHPKTKSEIKPDSKVREAQKVLQEYLSQINDSVIINKLTFKYFPSSIEKFIQMLKDRNAPDHLINKIKRELNLK